MEELKTSILIVDDVPQNIQILGNILRKEGYDIAFAKSGEETLKRVKNKDFDLILLDIMMPGMDGYETCKIIKEKEREKEKSETPIVFLTAKNDTESTVKGFKLGAVDFITKPFNATELLARVETHVSLKKSKKALEESLLKLEELNNAKDKFFSIIAHDIRNPLISFKGLTEVLMNKSQSISDEDKNEFIKLMHDSAKQLHSLLENLLEWSRVQTGGINFAPTNIDLCSLIESNIQLMEPIAINKKINIIKKINDNCMIHADKNMINTIIRNLLSNAIKFSHPENKIIIKLEANKEKGQIVLSIQDFGVGISEDNKKKMFRIDEHISTKGTQKEKGTGLGLILAKEFANMHEGDILVESHVNIGSTISLVLPLKK